MKPEDSAFIHALETASLDPEKFSHAQHVRAAWILFNTQPGLAHKRYHRALRRFAAAAGVPSKYHHTMTEALLKIIKHRMGDQQETWEDFSARNPDLFKDASGLLTIHYSQKKAQFTTFQTFIRVSGPRRVTGVGSPKSLNRWIAPAQPVI